jgi:alkylation response protein AidB-like acyl-CoA dehydrogenase
VYFALNAEQRLLQEAVAGFAREHVPMTRVREFLEPRGELDQETWEKMAGDLGLPGLHIPERHGGSGGGHVELALVFEVLGASLACVPYFSTVALAANLLLEAPDAAARDAYLPGISTGARTATLAYAEAGSGLDLSAATTAARWADGEWLLNGAKAYVIDGATADVIFTVARTPGGLSVFAVGGSARGLERRPAPTLDQTRNLASLAFTDTPGQLIGPEGGAADWIDRALALAAIAMAAEEIGGARRCLEMAVTHAKQRFQFGRPIGSFQAIKHKCADMLAGVEQGQAAVYYAAWTADTPGEDVLLSSSLAKACASEAYAFAAKTAMQIFGGMGYTWECDAHLYLKRSKSSELLLGTPAFQRERLAHRIGL